MKISLFSGFLLLSIFVLIGCKKDDESPPGIVFTLPGTGSSFEFGENIPIKATISDDKKIDFIRITVSDAGNNEYLQVINLTSSDKVSEVETLLQHNGKYLSSGTYYVKITAGDGTNEFTAFREIYLNELPRSLEKILLVKQNTSSIIGIDSLSSDGELMSFAFLNGRYEKGAVDSRFATFGFAESFSGGISSIDLNSLMVNASIGLPASAENGFYNCIIHDPYNHAIYFGGNESQIRMCTNQSVSGIAFVIPEDFIAEHFALNEDFFFVHARNLPSTQQNISVFNRVTGQFIQSLAIDMSVEIQGILASENDNIVFVAANTSSACEMRKYNNATNALNDVFTLYDQSPCTGIWQGKDGRFFVAHANGLVQYNNAIEIISTGVVLNPTTLKYDPVNDRIYATESTGLRILNGSGTSELAFHAITNCRDVLLLYNK